VNVGGYILVALLPYHLKENELPPTANDIKFGGFSQEILKAESVFTRKDLENKFLFTNLTAKT